MLDIYRSGSVIASVKIAEDTIYNGQINAEDKIKASFVTTSFLPINLGDYTFLNGKKYQINNLIDFELDHLFRYDITFESAGQYDLLSASFFESKVYGTVTEIVTKIVAAMNVKDSGWTVGDIEDSGVKITMDFYSDSCRSALTKTIDKFGLELSIVIKEISLKKKIETDSGLITFEYGKGKGLYSMKRKTSGEFFTRAYGLGSSDNIPAGYEAVDGRLTFTPGYVDKGVTDWGVFEKIIIFEEIRPERTSTLTSVSSLFKLADSTIDFNLADNFITGTAPKIVMKSGDLAGEEFEIITTSYNHIDKSFDIKPSFENGYEDSPSYSFPNAIVNIKSGDQYTLIGINLPQSYVDDAEDRLQAATQQYIDANGGSLEISFDLNINEKWIRDNNLENVLQLGTKVKVKNVASGIDVDLRITSISYPLLYPSRITCTVADKLPPNSVMEMQKIIVNTATKTTIMEGKNESIKTFTSIRLDELQSMVFDPLGNYYSSKIAPLSIETAQLQVGTRSQIFALGVSIKASTTNITLFEWEAGVLDHYTVIPNAITSWNISAGSITGLSATTAYYIYARCNKSNNNGVIILDTVQRPVATDSTYYYFLVGYLSSRILDRNGSYVRRASLSYGSTDVNGAFITTGAIISQDGLTQLNLDNGIYSGRIQFLLDDGSTYKNITTLNSQAITALADATDAKTKTDLLKDLAFEDLVEVAKLGSTVIVGGYIKTDLLDVDFIRTNVLQAEYIAALDVDFVQGTIGGINIEANSITSSNGKFEVTSDGILTVDGVVAINATITGMLRTAETGQRVVLNSTDNTLDFYDASSLLVTIGTSLSGWGGTFDGLKVGNGYVSTSALGVIGANLSIGSLQLSTTSNLLDGYTNYMSNGITIFDGTDTFTGKSKIYDFGGGKTITAVNGIIVDDTGF